MQEAIDKQDFSRPLSQAKRVYMKLHLLCGISKYRRSTINSWLRNNIWFETYLWATFIYKNSQYTLHIPDYCTIIWSRNRITIETILRFATRTALNAPYRSDNSNYIDFNTRMAKFRLLIFEERRWIAAIKIAIQTTNPTNRTSNWSVSNSKSMPCYKFNYKEPNGL